MKWGRLHRVPEIDWLKAPKPPFDFLDFSEATRLIDAAEGEWRAEKVRPVLVPEWIGGGLPTG